MTIESLEVSGYRSAFEALRLPYGLEPRSHTYGPMRDYNQETNCLTYGARVYVDYDDMELMKDLVKCGDEHAKILRGIVVHARICAPVYFFSELETYRAGHERLASESTMHIDCKGLSGDELVKAKAAIPMGRELMKIDMFSYQCLRNIYRQRKNHRLPQWHQFCQWIETLPFAAKLITLGLK